MMSIAAVQHREYSVVKYSAALPCPRMQIRDILARNTKRIRLKEGLSREELAHCAEIDRTNISALERSVYAASIDVVGRIAKALKVEPAALLAKPPHAQPKATSKAR